MGVMGIFTSTWPNAPLIVFLFLVRTGVNNAGYPIQKAVLMDYVPKVEHKFVLLLEILQRVVMSLVLTTRPMLAHRPVVPAETIHSQVARRLQGQSQGLGHKT